MPLITALRHSSARNPAKVAIAFGEESWTYSEFDRLTDHIARNLLVAGIEKGDRVALHLLNGPELSLSYIGCLKAGCTLVPINTRLKGQEVDYVLRQSGSVFYIGQPDLYAAISGSCPAMSELHARYLTGESGSKAAGSFHDLLGTPARARSLPEIAPEQAAAIMYTSGTTARPKGVVHTHETLAQTARAMRQMRLDEDQVVLIVSSMAHLIGFGMLFLSALLNGATTVITRPFEFPGSLDALERWHCTYMLGLPVMFKLLLETQLAAPRNVKSGKFYFGGGDCVSPALHEAFQRTFGPICEVYGATEMAPASWNRPGDVRVGSMGKPGDGITFRLMDSHGCDAGPGEVGEICIKGPHLMTGYWQEAEATAAAFYGDWFRTGDLAHRDPDGFYWFAGRKKEIIIRGGSNISPQEVEAVLYEHPAVAEVAVVGHTHPVWGETVAAHVVKLPGHQVEESELIAFARERLADYKTPETVIFQSELPKTPTGKLQRRALREAPLTRLTESSAV
jgi:long-chain acyl-CoA synthetase